MESGFRRIGPGHKIVRVPIDSAAASIAVHTGVADKVVDVIALSLSASAAGVIEIVTDETDAIAHSFDANNLAWVLPRNADAWAEAIQSEDITIANGSTLTIKGVIILLVMDVA